MRTWKDLGNGQHKLTITVDGDPTASPSVFRGTREQILDALAASQENANQRILELRRGSNGNTPPSAPAGPKPLTPSERMETVADLQNPATVDRVVTRVLESVVGPVDDFKKDQADERQERMTRTATQAASMFYERTPEWYPSPHNIDTLTKYMQAQKLNPMDTLSYTKAFETLAAANLLQEKPESEDQPQPEAQRERNAPDANAKPRAQRYSTSIRASDISGRAPVPSGKPHLKYTREQLQNLSSEDYKRLIQTDRAELERCESYYASQQGRRAG
jgi:hypothetical protein